MKDIKVSKEVPAKGFPLVYFMSFVSNSLDLLRKPQVGQAFSLTPFGNIDFGGLKARAANTYARGLL
jgi:hypothetical protein